MERVQKTPSPNLAQLFVQLAPLVDVVSAIAAKTDKVRDVTTDKVRGVTTDKVMVSRSRQTRLGDAMTDKGRDVTTDKIRSVITDGFKGISHMVRGVTTDEGGCVTIVNVRNVMTDQDRDVTTDTFFRFLQKQTLTILTH